MSSIRGSGLHEPDDHLFTIAEAARACRVSVKTIRRYVDRQKVDAYREPTSSGRSRWRISRGSLRAAGLKPYGSGAAVSTAPRLVDLREEDLRERLTDAQHQIAIVTAQKEAAEAVAEERARSLERADQALLILQGRLQSS